MSANGGARSPETIRSSLGRIGAQLFLKMTNGAVYFADVIFPPQSDANVTVWFWGTSHPSTICVEDVAIVTAADVTEHRTFAAIRERQRRELEGKNQ